MARIPQSFIDDLLTRIDIVDVVDKALPLKKSGSNYSARCPFHNEKTPSFSVSQRKQFYYCFGCGASGNALGFLIEHDRLGFVEAVEVLASQVGMEVPRDVSNQQEQDERKPLYPIMQQAADFYAQQLREHNAADKVKDYLRGRGLSGQTAKQFQVGFAPDGWDNLQKHLQQYSDEQLLACGLLSRNDSGKTYDRFRDRIIFPIRDRQGRVIGFGGRVLGDGTPKYLNSPETVIFHKGSELYGLYEAVQANRQLEHIIVVEGYMDVIALAQHGINNAVATLGTATTKLNAERLFRQSRHITFCFDGDKAGRAAAWRALENILGLLEDDLTIEFMFLPEGEDPDSLVQAGGQQAFAAELKQAMPLSRFLLKQLSEQTNLDTIDGRSRLVKLAEPMIKQIPGTIFQQLLLTELGKFSQMSSQELRSLYGLKALQSEPSRPAPYRRAKTEQSGPTIMQRTLSLLLQHPQLAQIIDNFDDFKELNQAGGNILIQVLEILKKDPNLNTGALLEHWREQPAYHSLAKLAMREILLPSEGLAAELTGLLDKLQQQSDEENLSTWQHKATTGQLSAEEKQHYLALLKAHKS